MLAVLPFVNLSGNPGEEYLADGMTEEIITQLGGLDPNRLGVIARTSSMQYKGAQKAWHKSLMSWESITYSKEAFAETTSGCGLLRS